MPFEESQLGLAENEIKKLENGSLTPEEIDRTLSALFDLQQGSLHESAADVKRHIWERDHYDHRLGSLDEAHRLSVVAVKRQMQQDPLGESTPIMLLNRNITEAIKAAGGPKGFLKQTFVVFAREAYKADPVDFNKRLRHNFLERNLPSQPPKL